MKRSEKGEILQAHAALEAFRTHETMLTGFARALTGNPRVVVKGGDMSATDGKTIWIAPPAGLLKSPTHDLTQCGIREPRTWKMVCEACHHRDTILGVVCHEIAHIIEESFEEIKPTHRKSILAQEGKNRGIPSERFQRVKGWIEAASVISPHLPWLLNGIEDARINRRMAEAREGVGIMQKAMTYDVLENGIERPDGTVLKWDEHNPDLQVALALYGMASGEDDLYRQHLDEEVVGEIMDDERIQTLMADAADSEGVKEVFQAAAKCLDIVQEYGRCLDDPPGKPEPGDGEPCPDGEPGEEGETGSSPGDDSTDTFSGGGGSAGASSDGDDDGEGSGGDDDDDGEGSGDDGDGDEADGDGDSGKSAQEIADEIEDALGRVSGHPGEDGGMKDAGERAEGMIGCGGANEGGRISDRALGVAVAQMEHFDTPSEAVTGVRYHEMDAATESYGSREAMMQSRRADSDSWVTEPVPGVVGPGVSRLRKIFDANRKTRYERHLRRGRRVDQRDLARKIPVGNYDIFTKKTIPGKKDYHVLIGLDMSGSTAGDSLSRANYFAAKKLKPSERRRRRLDDELTSADVVQTPRGRTATVAQTTKVMGFHVGEMLTRLNIDWSMYAHSGSMVYGDGGRYHGSGDYVVDLAPIKRPKDPWGVEQKRNLASVGPYGANLDGHTLEAYIKLALAERKSHTIVLYFNDGAMPAENPTEEREILTRTFEQVRKRRDLTVLSVGVHSDDPAQYGIDTVLLNTAPDLKVVIEWLEKHLEQ